MDLELVGYLDERFAYLDRRFGAIDQRFEAVGRRFDAIDRQFNAVDQRFEAVDRRFDAVDQRFDAMERRQDSTDARLEGTRRHLGVLIENLDGKIQLVAEGVINVDQKIDRVRVELKGEIAEVKDLLRGSYSDLDRRVRRLEADSG